MKVVFAGPSLFGADYDCSGLTVRHPARQGDVARAAIEGATAIGLIDGVFDAAAAVWHKEILYALSLGVRVLGAASMGALRAAECAAYGMEPVGQIAMRYLCGELDDDAAVALTFGPPELGFMPLTEPMVDVIDKVKTLVASGAATYDEGHAILEAGERLFYADRTVQAMLQNVETLDVERRAALAKAYASAGPSAKQRDALTLLAAIRQDVFVSPVTSWRMAEPQYWKQTLSRLVSEVGDLVTLESRSI